MLNWILWTNDDDDDDDDNTMNCVLFAVTVHRTRFPFLHTPNHTIMIYELLIFSQWALFRLCIYNNNFFPNGFFESFVSLFLSHLVLCLVLLNVWNDSCCVLYVVVLVDCGDRCHLVHLFKMFISHSVDRFNRLTSVSCLLACLPEQKTSMSQEMQPDEFKWYYFTDNCALL